MLKIDVMLCMHCWSVLNYHATSMFDSRCMAFRSTPREGGKLQTLSYLVIAYKPARLAPVSRLDIQRSLGPMDIRYPSGRFDVVLKAQRIW